MATLNHMGLTVRDLEASVAFYRDVAGMTEGRRNETGGPWFDRLTGNEGARIRVAHLTLGGFTLQLVQYLAAGGEALTLHHRRGGNPHLCFNVPDFQRRRELALACGSAFVSPIERLPGGKRSFYVADPDGLPVELMEDLTT
jgi:catechol 2,3-dioxygenase-like lactoylglutathione lyase family enzyme